MPERDGERVAHILARVEAGNTITTRDAALLFDKIALLQDQLSEAQSRPRYGCCYVPIQAPPWRRCPEEAEWVIIHDQPNRTTTCCTESCTAHVGQMLTDASVHEVVRIEKP